MFERLRDFPDIFVYRFPGGEEARVRGTRLSVWRIADLASRLGTAEAVALHYRVEPALIEEALRYAALHPTETKREAELSRCNDFESLRNTLPNVHAYDAGE